MQGWLRQFRSFWDAEEVPRRIGLLLVGVFVVVVGSLLILSQQRTSTAIVAYAEKSLGQSVAFLADVLAPGQPQVDRMALASMNRFAQAHHCINVRIFDSAHTVLASTIPSEAGLQFPSIESEQRAVPQGLETQVLQEIGSDGALLLARAPLKPSGSGGLQYVEARFGRAALVGSAGSLQMLLVSLISAGAFLLLYSYLRKHFRSMKQIAQCLEGCNESGGVSVDSMRLAHAPDVFARSWNGLVDRMSEQEEELARSFASSELLAALDRSNTGELAEALRLVPLGVMLVSDELGVIYSNAMSCRLMAWLVDDESSWQLGAGVEMNDDAVQIADQIRACAQVGDSSRTIDHQIEAVDGSFYSLRIIPLNSAQHSRRIVVLIQDVSQQVRSDKAREEFVSQVTHELRTPLTNIRAYAETLSSGMFDDPKVITECYNVITKETRRLSRLIEDILSISQLEVGTMQLVMDRVDMRELLTESVRDVRGLAEAKNIDLQLALPPKIAPLKGDRDKLAVVMNNLLGNALKYTPENGQVALSCKSGDASVTVSVRDSGFGIDSCDHERIFEKFQRAEDPDVLQETGTGIGLTTAREIVRQHGGDISLVSKKGEGSTFSFTLEAANVANAVQSKALT